MNRDVRAGTAAWRGTGARRVALPFALIAAVFLAACGGSAPDAPAGMSSAPAASVASSPAAGTPGSSAASPGGSGWKSSPTTPASDQASGTATLDPAGVDAQTVKDEARDGSGILDRFLRAVNARDVTAAQALLTPDAAFQVEDVMNAARRISPGPAGIRLLPDEEGLPHLALEGTGSVDVVAAAGSGLQSGRYSLSVTVRRESRRDEWGISSFELQPQ